MELTYQSPMMPAAYAVISADEMTYIDGGALQIGSYLIEFHPENLLTAAVNFTVNFAQLIDRKSTRLNSSHMPKSRMPSSA